jgi:predicted  nucleic acid-binding Zn-ribbon protein
MSLAALEEQARRLQNQINSTKHRLADAERAHDEYPDEQDPVNDIAYYEDEITTLEAKLEEVEEEIRNGPIPE